MRILVLNAGSSSLKYQLFDMKTKKWIAKGLCEKIGLQGSAVKHSVIVKGKEKSYTLTPDLPTHQEALACVLDCLTNKDYSAVIKSLSDIDAVGHRIVHGGKDFTESVVITDQVVELCKKNYALAPLHNPANVMGINACKAKMPKTPMVAVFDTAFHSAMPDFAYIYALPYAMYEKLNVRKYGFHGNSHQYVSEAAIKYLKKPKAKIITCHLGNGSSIAAVKEGKSIDTSMGFTPLEGLPMGTRCGDIDPSIVEYLCKTLKRTVAEINAVLNTQSGVKGLSGVSSDFREVHAAANDGNARAELALQNFAYKCKKYIGSYMAAMGGVDAIVFTGGIGENDADMRTRILSGLEGLGIKINEKKNTNKKNLSSAVAEIGGGKVKVLVIPTNEELVIAQETEKLVK